MSKYVKGDGLAVIDCIRTSELDERYRLSNKVGYGHEPTKPL